jgi:hypothetical protein
MVKALIGTEVDDVFKYPSGFFIDLRIFRCLSKYLFREKIQWYFWERCSENMYVIKNKDHEPKV